MKKYFLILTFSLVTIASQAQQAWGTTGLLHLPTADMQRDKTFMAGWTWLDERATPDAKRYGWAQEPTMNYYINVTIFPWMEVGYCCTLIRGKYLGPSYGLNPDIFDKWANQDRHFDFRFRLWKEGWWKPWTPQVVVGFNDALHTFEQNGTSGNIGTSDSGNGYWGRQYIAVTKHFCFPKIGTMGAHVAYMHNKRADFHYEGVGAGINFRFDQVQTGKPWLDRCIHGLNLMAEYDTRTWNVGAQYSAWKDRINAFVELIECKHPSAGLCFKICLK